MSLLLWVFVGAGLILVLSAIRGTSPVLTLRNLMPAKAKP